MWLLASYALGTAQSLRADPPSPAGTRRQPPPRIPAASEPPRPPLPPHRRAVPAHRYPLINQVAEHPRASGIVYVVAKDTPKESEALFQAVWLSLPRFEPWRRHRDEAPDQHSWSGAFPCAGPARYRRAPCRSVPGDVPHRDGHRLVAADQF
ncbi:hypothetical protein GCM10010327_50740 [Streptomyces nitrosporeus]|nr:hypothetical protein GCM10010327_50740 [Streptomyces nitrosporeus]